TTLSWVNNMIYQWRVLYRMMVNLFQRPNSLQAKAYLKQIHL
ncbi:Isoleucine--tRNA ligase, partial [Haemophilus influenzae]